jgi:hypothetical protein
MTLYSLVNRGIYEHVAGECRRGGGPKYIHRLQVIEEYIPEEYSDIYSSALYSSVT